MWAICMHEFKNLFKGFKSIFIILFLVGISYLFAYLGKTTAIVEGMSSEELYTAGLTVLIVFFGTLFTFVLSHDVLSKEVQTRTIRFLVTKTTRKKIIAGKTLAIILFWLVCLSISLAAISIYAKAFFLTTLLQCIVFLTYGISLAVLASSLVSKTSQSLMIGIGISLVLPVIGMLTLLIDNIFFNWIKYLTPYYYLDLPMISLFGIIILAFGFIIAATVIFERKDL
ncbi:MAG: ABC transporter permease [Bacillus sp. (in: firmicutes)]